MGVSEILELIKAGYSKEEIEKMAEEAPESKPGEKEKSEKISDPAAESKPETKTETKPDERDKEIEALKLKVKQLQDEAAAGARQTGKKEEAMTAEKAIMDFITSL